MDHRAAGAGRRRAADRPFCPADDAFLPGAGPGACGDGHLRQRPPGRAGRRAGRRRPGDRGDGTVRADHRDRPGADVLAGPAHRGAGVLPPPAGPARGRARPGAAGLRGGPERGPAPAAGTRRAGVGGLHLSRRRGRRSYRRGLLCPGPYRGFHPADHRRRAGQRAGRHQRDRGADGVVPRRVPAAAAAGRAGQLPGRQRALGPGPVRPRRSRPRGAVRHPGRGRHPGPRARRAADPVRPSAPAAAAPGHCDPADRAPAGPAAGARHAGRGLVRASGL
jgi:hypothetical protein